MKLRFLFLVFILTLLNSAIRAGDDQQVWAAQVGAKAVLNAKDAPFSAKGDGTTDDTAALQAAINIACAPGQPTAKILLLPPGTYLVSSTLQVKNTRYFRMVGGGAGATTLLWNGNSTSPALTIVNASFSEFSNFGISVLDRSVQPPTLQTGILVANDPIQPGPSTSNIFRNLDIGSTFNRLNVGVQIGGPEGGELQNDRHRFLNCTFANLVDRGIVVQSPVALDLLFYNVVVMPADGIKANAGLDLLGGSFYWLNGAVASALTAFNIVAPTGPVEINLSNEEGCGKLLQAQASAGHRLDLGLDNNRFANSPDTNFVTIDGPGNVRITRNHFNNYSSTPATGAKPAYPGSPNGFCILRSGALADDVFEFQYNRVFGFTPAQAITGAGLFPGQKPSLSCANHYWGWPISDLVAGLYDSTTNAPPPADTTELDRQLARLRGLSDSQALFIGRVTNMPPVANQSGRVIDVRLPPYNAKGDGVTNDTAAFQNALLDLQINGWYRGLLLIPAGNYVIKKPLVVGKSAIGVHLVGEGSANSRILWGGTTGGTIIDSAGVFFGEIRGIGITLTAGSVADYGLRLRSAGMVASRDSVTDVAIDGSSGILTTALKVGDGADVPIFDRNNDFHIFQNIVVSGYRTSGIDVTNTQIYNLVFLDCLMQGAPAGAGFVSQIGLFLNQGTLAWFGGGGQNHSLYALEIGTYGNAPVVFHDATFTGSPQLVNTGDTFCSMVFLDLDHVRFTSNGSSNNFLNFDYPGLIVVENCTFQLNQSQKIRHFGDYSQYISPLPADKTLIPSLRAAYKSLNGFALLNNTFVSTSAAADNLFVGDAPTVSSGNQFLPSLIPPSAAIVTLFLMKL